MRKPRALRPGDRVAVVSPASPFKREEFEAGLVELRTLGFEPVFEESVFARQGYVSGAADIRAAAFTRAWADPEIAALVAVRGGYGSVQLLPLLDRDAIAHHPKAFIGYSDNTSLLSWLTLTVRHRLVSRPDGRRTPGSRRGRIRPGYVHPVSVQRRASRGHRSPER